MRKCTVCEGVLPEPNFEGDNPVCKVCVHKLQNSDFVSLYMAPQHRTVRDAYVNLVLAIRRQAVIDDKIEEWEAFWILTDPWSCIWRMLQEASVSSFDRGTYSDEEGDI